MSRDEEQKKLHDIKRRFLLINRERLLRAQDLLPKKKQAFLDLLPLLLHTNAENMPGYIEDAPIGVSDYTPSKEVLALARQLDKNFTFQKKALGEYHVYSIFLMGSSGTIAYTAQSDFDIWVCIQPGLQDDSVQKLRRKLARITRWGKELGLEANFFIVDHEKFRAGENQESLSDESSGQIQHDLLLEEFYRTGLYIAGRYPVWWQVPVEHESEYDNYVQRLVAEELIDESEIIDFGGLSALPASEFYGAAMWQLYKAVESPYKSLLKILLMESYARSYPNVSLLSHRLKETIYKGESNLDKLDSYILMYQHVEDYLQSLEEPQRLELARRSFYIKANEPMDSKTPATILRNRKAVFEDMTRCWEWSEEHISKLNHRDEWSIHDTIDERNAVINELKSSYQLLTQFAQLHGGTTEHESSDLTLLSRKIYAAFEPKLGKVDLINTHNHTPLHEEMLTFHQVHMPEANQDGWFLFEGEYTEAASDKERPIKRAYSLIELISWCHFNNVMDNTTGIRLHHITNNLDYVEMRHLISMLQDEFPNTRLPECTPEDLAASESITRAVITINPGIDPLHKFTKRGLEIISERTDALSYSGFWENLVSTVELLIVTTWNEVLTFRYQGDSALMDAFCDYFSWFPTSEQRKPFDAPIYCFSKTRGGLIAERVRTLFSDMKECFYGDEANTNARFMLRMRNQIYAVQLENHVPRYVKHNSLEAGIKYLGAAQSHFSPIIVDQSSFENSILAVIAGKNEPDQVQMFYIEGKQQADVYIADEKGSLFHQAVPYFSNVSLISQYQYFLEATYQRLINLGKADKPENVSEKIHFYQVKEDKKKQLHAEKQWLKSNKTTPGYLSLRAFGDLSKQDGTIFTMQVNNRDFSTLEYGKHVFLEIARYVMSLRKSHEAYPIYITDLDLSTRMIGSNNITELQTIHFLQYKKWIEEKLNQALNSISSEQQKTG